MSKELEYILDDIKQGIHNMSDGDIEDMIELLNEYCSDDYWEEYGYKNGR